MFTEILSRLNAGDKAAFASLYDLSYEKLYRFIYHRTMDSDETQDIISDAYMKALKKIDNFHGKTEGEFFSWMYRIAYTTMIDHVRSKKPVEPIESAEYMGAPSHIESDVYDQLTLEKVLAFLETLPERERSILTMRIWDDLSYDEISGITGESVSNAKKIVSRTLMKVSANVSYLFIFSLLLYVYTR